MSDASNRICPTRTDGRPSLFAHKVTLPQCQARQRESFHKCFTCAHNNNLQAAQQGLPPRQVERLGKRT